MRISNDKASKRGSALLIVLGFLTFITISAVAFAIYMRVERQATANYRHSIAARHLLETAFFRAMDEVDGELRLNSTSRFPANWTGGRVLASPAVVMEESDASQRMDTSAKNRLNRNANLLEARLLSFEALSFLPASVVNTVRSAAVMTETNNTDAIKMGAKWRSLSMPIQNKTDILGGSVTNSAGRSVVGQYAYLCVNLSDMLDVNNSSVDARSVKAPVSIAHLFTAAASDRFNEQRSNDVYYATLQDFYNCMGRTEGGQKFFADGMDSATTDSPYLSFLRGDRNAAFNGADNHVLVTDALAKAEPNRSDAFNLKDSPFEGSTTPPVFKADFRRALERTFQNQPNGSDLMFGTGQQAGGTFAAMLYDYLSLDKKPARLNVPTGKLAPMIARICVSNIMLPKVYKETPGDPATTDTPVYLQLIGGNNAGAGGPNDLVSAASAISEGQGMTVISCWPFRNVDSSRYGEFTVKVEGWLYVEPGDVKHTTRSFTDAAFSGPTTFRFEGESVQPIPIPDLKSTDDDMGQCFISSMVRINFVDGNASLKRQIGTIPAGGTTAVIDPPWTGGFSTAIIVFVKVLHNGVIVDSAPQYAPQPSLNLTAGEFGDESKIFFQSNYSGAIDSALENALGWAWNALEAPDPRFNHLASNWVQPDPTVVPPGNFKALSDYVKGLFGKDGRDSDFFMSPGGAGATDGSGALRLQSPGELGFIIRPYNFYLQKDWNNTVDFRTRTDGNRLISAIDDSDAYFRTVRLYDHEKYDGGWVNEHQNTFSTSAEERQNHTHDPVYKHFYAANDDGTFLDGSRARVNPLSTLDTVLVAAIDNVPHDYWYATENAKSSKYSEESFELDDPVVDNWFYAVTNFVREARVGLANDPYTSIRTVYPELRRWGTDIANRQGWYPPAPNPNNPRVSSEIFGVNAGVPLSEADRKMIYTFSLDSFSDRQQLFLYIMQAESLALAVGGESRSLAGGKAVALVWRDPYPKGAEINTSGRLYIPPPPAGNNWYYHAETRFATDDYYKDRFYRSPWWDVKSPKQTGKRNTSEGQGYHEHQILFFKQLSN